MPNKKLGVIGGMGPLATSIFFQRIVENTVAKKDQEHLDAVIINHATMPDRTDAILNNKKETFLNAIRNDIELLNHANVANIAIPCNTSHYFYEDIKSMTNINIINMVESTVIHIKENFGELGKVAVLGTTGTIKSNVYAKELMKHGLSNYELKTELMNEVMDIIYHIKSDNNYVPENFNELIHELIHVEKCTSVILACTELSSIKLENSIQPYCVDALDILVKESIILSGKQLTENFRNKLYK